MVEVMENREFPVDTLHLFKSPAFEHWRDMTDVDWEHIIPQGNIFKKEKGSLLYGNSHSKSNQFCIVLSGVVKVYSISEIGRGIYISSIGPGDFCPLQMSILLNDPFIELQSIASTDVVILSFSKDIFFNLHQNSPQFSTHILTMTSRFSRTLVDLVRQVSFQRLPMRVANHLCKNLEQDKSPFISCTHQTLANELGTTREVMSRLLKDMEQKGCIKLKRGTIEVLSIEGLKNYSCAK